MTSNLPASKARNRLSVMKLVGIKARFVKVFAALTVVTACSVTSCSVNAPQSSAAELERPVTQSQVADKVHECSACHGVAGRFMVHAFPILAGQQQRYLVSQLKAFRDKTRTDPPGATLLMAPKAAGLDNKMIEHLASYYSGQNPLPGSAQNPTYVAAGRTIYKQGVADKVLACMACHGAKAGGFGLVPRLAGQTHFYLIHQIADFAAKSRPGNSMHQEVINLTDRQTRDVVDYTSAETVGKPASPTHSDGETQRQFARTVAVCSACHEFGGRGARISPAFTFPRLAGQQKDYLVAQITAFRDKTRADPRARAYMWDHEQDHVV